MSQKFIVNVWVEGFNMIVYYFWEFSYIVDGNGFNISIIKGNFSFIS